MIRNLIRGHGAVTALILGLLVLVGYLMLWPAALGGVTGYVTIRGSSMEPRFHSGDLALVRPSGSYAVGDIVAYRSQSLHTTVMHRIVSVQNGRYSFKGDNNSFLDPEYPSSGQLIGKLVVRIPQWSHDLRIATGPIGIIALGIALTLGGGGSARRKIRRKRGTMSRIAPPLNHATFAFLKNLPRPLAIAATLTSSAVALGVVLLVMGWTAPIDTTAVAQTGQATRQTVFSYSASVRPSAAYDGTTVASPDPVFRKVAQTVDVHLTYTGTPGTLDVLAQLSNPSGWHSTVDLTGPIIAGKRVVRTVPLDLASLQARSDAAAAAIGLQPSQVNISIQAIVRSGTLPVFTPTLKLTLTPLALTLAGNPSSLTVTDATPGSTAASSKNHVVTVAGHKLAASTVHAWAIWLFLASAVSIILIVVLARRGFTASEGTRIRRRYSPLMVPVEPMSTPPGRPVVTVTDITTLVKLAERYRLLVLHWERSGIETFVVQDENTTYCFRTGAVALDPEMRQTPSPSHAEDPEGTVSASKAHGTDRGRRSSGGKPTNQ